MTTEPPTIEPGHGAFSGDLLAKALQVVDATIDVRMDGHSMAPTVPHGAVIRIGGGGPDAVRVGEPLAFLAAGTRLTIHRLIQWDRGRRFALTRGDGNLFCDPPVPVGDVLGPALSWADAGPATHRPIGSLAPRGILTRMNERAMKAALFGHVRLAQSVAAVSLLAILPYAVLRYGRAAWSAPAFAMFRLRRPERK